MTTEEALRAALLDAPCDDATWLVLADLLEEEGQAERSALLRLHRELRGLPAGGRRGTAEKEVQRMLLAGVRPCVPTVVNSVGMVTALVPPGEFWLGSPATERGRYDNEGPRRRITITRPFYLGVQPVTQAEYEKVTGSNPSAFSTHGSLAALVKGRDTARHPVEGVSWEDAVLFCRLLGALPAERQAGRVYGLPTEAQWEYACRGGASQDDPFTFGEQLTPRMANFRDRPRARGARRTTPVGKYPPNAFGLFDMHGNVWEWCADWFDMNAYADNPSSDPPGPVEGDQRNVRGGTYNLEARRARSADRSSFDPGHRDTDLGFRVLCLWAPRA